MNEPSIPAKPQGGTPRGDDWPTPAQDPSDPTRKFESRKTDMRGAADDPKTATRTAEDEYRGKAEQVWGDAQERVRSLRAEGEQYVRENPTKAICSVLGIGFVLGIIFRR